MYAYQRKIAFHGAKEALPVLLGSNDSWFTLGATSKECGVLDPAF